MFLNCKKINLVLCCEFLEMGLNDSKIEPEMEDRIVTTTMKSIEGNFLRSNLQLLLYNSDVCISKDEILLTILT